MNPNHERHHSASATAAEAAPGIATRLITRWFFRQATVTDTQPMAPGMHLITLEGPALCGLSWSPGDKLQVRLGPALQTRTYTPLNWDAAAGRTQLLAHALAAGPGSDWVRQVVPGQAVSLMGPRTSLGLSDWDAKDGLLVGDETALALAAAWKPSQALFELGNPPAMQALLDDLGLRATARRRLANEEHLGALIQDMTQLATPQTRFVLVGRARTVQALLRALRQMGVPAKHIRTKAYWADGKVGLD